MESDQLMGKIHDFIDLITDCLAGRSYDLSIWSDSVNDSIVTVTVNRCFFHSFFEEVCCCAEPWESLTFGGLIISPCFFSSNFLRILAR